MAVYWGQDDGTTKEDSIKVIADEGSVGRIYLSFALPCPGSKIFSAGGASYVDLNLAGHANGDLCEVLSDYPGVSGDCSSLVPDCTKCASCDMPLAQQIKYAQGKGIEVLLSVGGGAQSEGGVPDAAQLAQVLSDMYLTPNSGFSGPRPFGDVVLDGIDLDLEQEWGKFPTSWMPAFLAAFPQEPLLTIAPQCFDFNTQYRASIASVMAASKATNELLHPEQVCRFDSLNVQFYNNEGALDDGTTFSTSGTDAALAKALDDAPADCWDDYTYGWFQDGKPHCYASKFLTTAAIWADVAKQCTDWRAASGRGGVTQFVFGTAVDQLAPDGSSGALPWAKYVGGDLAKPRRHIAQLLQAMSAVAGDTFGGVMLWDRGNDLTIGARMAEGAKPTQLFKEALDAQAAVPLLV